MCLPLKELRATGTWAAQWVAGQGRNCVGLHPMAGRRAATAACTTTNAGAAATTALRLWFPCLFHRRGKACQQCMCTAHACCQAQSNPAPHLVRIGAGNRRLRLLPAGGAGG